MTLLLEREFVRANEVVRDSEGTAITYRENMDYRSQTFVQVITFDIDRSPSLLFRAFAPTIHYQGRHERSIKTILIDRD